MSAPATGRAWLPASTGLPTQRAPTRDELHETWMRQARGVFEMTGRARGGDGAAVRANAVVALLLVLIGGGFASGLLVFPATAVGGLVVTLHVVAGLMLLLAQIAGPTTMAADAVAEVTAKSAQAWASSPLRTSAWVAGKVAFYVQSQAMASLRVSPLVAASAMLGGLKLRESLAIAVLGLLWTLVAGASVAAASLEPRSHLAARLAAKRGPLTASLGGAAPLRNATPPAAAFAVVQVALGIAGLFIAMPFAFGGVSLSGAPPGVSLLLAVVSVLSPLGAGASAFFPGLGVTIFGIAVPMWVLSLVVGLAVAPSVLAASRLRWRPPDDSRGEWVRPGVWLAWTVVFGLALAILAPSAPSAAIGLVAFLLIAAVIPPLAAGVTRLPDLAAREGRTLARIAGLDRSTAEAHGLIVLALASLAFMAVAPAGLFANVSTAVGVLVLAVAVIPCVIASAAMGREVRRALAKAEAGVKERSWRPATIVFIAFVVAAFAPIPAAILQSSGLAFAVPLVEAAGLLSPLHLLIALALDVLGIRFPGVTPPASPTSPVLIGGAFLAQLAMAWAARRLERRFAATDDFVATPLPPPEG